jgi:hypothetical protein
MTMTDTERSRLRLDIAARICAAHIGRDDDGWSFAGAVGTAENLIRANDVYDGRHRPAAPAVPAVPAAVRDAVLDVAHYARGLPGDGADNLRRAVRLLVRHLGVTDAEMADHIPF